MDMFAAEMISKEEFNQHVGDSKQRMEKIESELKLVKHRISKTGELKSILEKTFKTIEDIIDTGEMTNGQLRKIIEKIEVDHDGNVDIYMKLTERLNLARTVPISGCLTYRHDGAACGDCSSFVGKVKGGFVLNLRSWRHLRDVAKISMKVENANRE